MSVVYFIKPVGMDGPIKIGHSTNPPKRLLDLGAWSPFPLELIGSVPGVLADESFIHDCFADIHSHREWFKPEPALLQAIAKVLAAGSVDVLRGVLTPTGKIRGRARNYSSDWRLFLSYGARVRVARHKLRRLDEKGAWHEPPDVEAIIECWRSTRVRPADADIARLDEYLKNPTAHSVIPPWRRVAA